MKTNEKFELGLKAIGMSRRDFMKYCSAMAVYMGLPFSMGGQIAEAVAGTRRPSVIWISGQECTGCVESLLRATHPTLETLILDMISLDYSETLAAASGHQVEAAKAAAMKENKGKYILVVDGAVPVKDGGIYCKIAGRTMIDIAKNDSKDAAAVIAMGSCASWGGVASAEPNPTGATGIGEIFKQNGIKKPLINIPGCPPSPYNFLSVVLYYLTLGKLPKLDKLGRPLFAYGRLIHENCERRPHFDAGRFAQQFGDEGHREGYCLYQLGCKGPVTYNNCSQQLFGDAGPRTWPVGTGHPCFGCSENKVGFNVPLHDQAKLHHVTPPACFLPEDRKRGKGATIAGTAVIAGAAGVGLGAMVKVNKALGEHDKTNNNDPKKED